MCLCWSHQLAARELLQQGHENTAILDVPEQVLDLGGRVTLRPGQGGREREEERKLGRQMQNKQIKLFNQPVGHFCCTIQGGIAHSYIGRYYEFIINDCAFRFS